MPYARPCVRFRLPQSEGAERPRVGNVWVVPSHNGVPSAIVHRRAPQAQHLHAIRSRGGVCATAQHKISARHRASPATQAGALACVCDRAIRALRPNRLRCGRHLAPQPRLQRRRADLRSAHRAGRGGCIALVALRGQADQASRHHASPARLAVGGGPANFASTPSIARGRVPQRGGDERAVEQHDSGRIQNERAAWRR